MRRKKVYFETLPDAPKPVRFTITRKLRFSDADPLGIAWHGNYPAFFEEAQAELARLCGLTFEAYRNAGVAAPVVQLHTDYYRSLYPDEQFSVTASMVWSEGARINTEYEIRNEDGELVCTGFTVQMFIDLKTREPLFCSPPFWDECRRKWREGAFHA